MKFSLTTTSLSLGLALLTSHISQASETAQTLLEKATFESLIKRQKFHQENFWVEHSFQIPFLSWGLQVSVREALEQFPDIKITQNEVLGKVAFLLHAKSKVTTGEILTRFKKESFPIAPKVIQQRILQHPKFRYIVKFKETNQSKIINTYQQSTIRQHIKKELNCDQVIFTDSTAEIWSEKQLEIKKLVDNPEFLKHYSGTVYGGGILSTELLRDELK